MLCNPSTQHISFAGSVALEDTLELRSQRRERDGLLDQPVHPRPPAHVAHAVVLLGFRVLRLAQRKEREGGGHTWRIRSSPAKRWAKTGQMAPPLGPVVAAREERSAA